MSKNDKKFLIIVFAIVPLIMFIFWKLMFVNSGVTCAKVTNIGNIKGSEYINYSYSVKGEIYTEGMSIDYFKIRDINKLKELGCFKIEYSKIIPSWSRIIDKRVKR